MAELSNTICLDDKLSPQILAGILGINVSLVYQNAQAGILPLTFTELSYRQALQIYIAHYKKNVELKILKEQNEQELRKKKLEEDRKFREEKVRIKELEVANRKSKFIGTDGYDDSMHPLVAAKMKQDIRLGIVKEQQLWLKVAIDRGDYVSMNELYSLCEPFLQAIKNKLVALADEFPELETSIDDTMESLYNLGVKMLEKATIDGEEFVQKMMDTEFNPDAAEQELTTEMGIS